MIKKDEAIKALNEIRFILRWLEVGTDREHAEADFAMAEKLGLMGGNKSRLSELFGITWGIQERVER